MLLFFLRVIVFLSLLPEFTAILILNRDPVPGKYTNPVAAVATNVVKILETVPPISTDRLRDMYEL